MSHNILILNVQAALGLAIVLIAFLRYARPRLDALSFNDAVLPLVLLQSFRFLGLTFIVDHQIADAIPRSAATLVALGDFSAAIAAFLTVIAILMKSRFVKPLAWVLTVVGIGDLAAIGPIAISNRFFEEGIGAMWLTIGTFAPVIIVAHGYIVYRLLNPEPSSNGATQPA
jgi:hypothetical protein